MVFIRIGIKYFIAFIIGLESCFKHNLSKCVNALQLLSFPAAARQAPF